MSILASLFLLVSSTSLIIQLMSMWRLRNSGVPDNERRRIRRTVVSRTVAAVAYLVFGAAAAFARGSSPTVGLLLFSGVQALWWANSLADTRRLKTHEPDNPT